MYRNDSVVFMMFYLFTNGKAMFVEREPTQENARQNKMATSIKQPSLTQAEASEECRNEEGAVRAFKVNALPPKAFHTKHHLLEANNISPFFLWLVLHILTNIYMDWCV